MAEFAALGTSGLSLGLGIYNTTQIASLREEMAAFSQTTEPTLDVNDFSLTTQTVSEVVVPDTPLVVKSVTASDSPEISEIQTRLSDLETFSNIVSTRSTSNLSKVTIAADDIDRLETHVTSELVNVRSDAASSGNEIATNAASIGMAEISIQDLNSDLVVSNDTADKLASSVSDIASTVDTTVSRTGVLESNQQIISSGLTNVTLAADQLGDNLTLVDGIGQDTKSNLETLVSAWNNFNATAFVASNTLNVTNLQASSCKLGLTKNDGVNSAIHFNSLLATNWSMYFATTTGLAPDGKTPAGFGDVSSWAIRMKLDLDAKNGFIIENGDSSPLYSISSAGVSKQLGNAQISNCKMGESEDWAIFSNSARFSGASFALAQHSTGATTLNCGNSKVVSLAVNGTTKAFVSKDTSLTVKNKSDEVWSTIFNHNDTGENFFRATTAHRFQFAKSSAGETSITSDEITVGGKAMKAALEALEVRVATLESKNNVQIDQVVYLKNRDNSKYLSKATSNDDALVNRTAKETRSSFWISE